MNDTAPTGMTVVRFFGLALMAIGGLMAVLCGLCSLVVSPIVVLALTHGPDPEIAGLPTVFLVIGVLPTAVGAALFLAGRKLFSPDAPPFLGKFFEGWFI